MMLYAAGQYANLLTRALTVTPTPAADAFFVTANLYNGLPSRPFRFGSNSANPEVRWDLAAFTPASGAATYTITARAGERRRINSSGTTSITLQNLTTLKYLAEAGAWQTGSTTCLSGDSGGSLDYQVETFSQCQAATVSLKIVVSTGTTVGDWPRWNAVVVVGHNLDVGLTCELRSSTDNFSGSNVLYAYGTILHPNFFMLQAGGITHRYGQIRFAGTNSVTPWIGELIPCWLETATKAPDIGLEVRYDEPQVRGVGPWGETFGVRPFASWPRRVIQMQFGSNAQATGAVEMRQEIVLRSRGGTWPIVLVPVDTESDVYYGRVSEKWTETRFITARYRNDLVVAEDPIAQPLT